MTAVTGLIWKRFQVIMLMFGLLVLLTAIGCSGGGPEASTETIADESPADKVAAKKKESLPAPSSLSDPAAGALTLTAHDLVIGISGNNIKQNIKEYFGKFADITGPVVSVTELRGTVEVLLDGETDKGLNYVTCKMSDYDQEQLAGISVGEIVTVHGQIKAMKEVPGQAGSDNNLLKTYGQIVKPCSLK